MTFISYAQNFEDVMLWRALQYVDRGFYIDVGANAPSEDSVTRAFYDKGWNGINIEPLNQHHAELLKARPRDINLCCAAGSQVGTTEIWQCGVRGWATLDEKTILAHETNGVSGSFSNVTVETLRRICEQHAPAEIHFLKIDVEGFEQAVLEGMDFQKYRPWIVLLEATRPNSTEENHWEWEPILTSNSYNFVYADGINRFYLAAEHHALTSAFRYPPNFLDAFQTAGYLEIHRVAQAAQADAHTASSKLQAADARVLHAEHALERMEQRALRAEFTLQKMARLPEAQRTICPLGESSAWQISSRIRAISTHRIAAKLSKNILKKIKRETNRLLRQFTRMVGKYRNPKNIIYFITESFSWTKKTTSKTAALQPPLQSLTLRELRIYRELNAKRKKIRKGGA